MSLVDRIARCCRFDAGNYVPVYVEGASLGYVTSNRAVWLAAQGPAAAGAPDGGVVLAPGAADAAERTERLRSLWNGMRAEGWLPGWRDEDYAVGPPWGGPALFHMERSAVDVLGLPGHGTHLNGYVTTDAGLEVWVARRAATKPTFPGLLDHLAAGGLPAGALPRLNMAKEAHEEAGMDDDLFALVTEGATLTYRCELPWGVRQDTLFTFDAVLPETWTPSPADGEVAAFERWPVARVLQRMRETEDFKFNVPPVLLVSLLDGGWLVDDPEADAVAKALEPLRLQDPVA